MTEDLDDRPRPPRYRCTTCGNLTRFDVTATRTTRAFHHYTVGGDLGVEEVEVVHEAVESVACRWCGPAGRVEVVSDEQAGAGALTPSDPPV